MTGSGSVRERVVREVIGAPIDVLSRELAVQQIARWALAAESRYVCICNAHSVVTAAQDDHFRAAVVGADMATPDGAPVAWMMRRLGDRQQQRVSGPDLMIDYLRYAAEKREPVYLLGSTAETVSALRGRLQGMFPTLRIAGWECPPFRPPTPDEDAATVERINASGARTVWVSLGCPKQELWMAAHKGRVRAVMLGVGAAFDFHAGTVTRAPPWMQRAGLEWFHRLCSEPRRLWRRYLTTNTAFVIAAARQLLSRH